MTAEQSGKLLQVVPEMDGHRLELQWAVAPETKAYKTFPCSYLRSACTPSTHSYQIYGVASRAAYEVASRVVYTVESFWAATSEVACLKYA